MNNEPSNERRFDKFEKLDRKVEETIQQVETMTWRQRLRKFTHNSFFVAAVWAVLLNLLIETLGRFPTTTVFGGLQFMVQHPLIFFYNAMIIFATLVIASIFKRRLFVFTIITIFWLAIGIVNGVILTQRMTPFTVKDLSILDDGISIVTNYLSTAQIAMAIGGVVSYGQATRNSVIAVSEDDFILTAKSKGLSNNKVIYGHMLRNAMLPIVTQLGMNVSALIGGAVVIEQIFNWNGMGTLFLTANSNNDYPLMMGIMIFMSAFALVANLLTDFVYCLLDPRVTLGGRR